MKLNHFDVETGAEGPQYDPYGYTEYTFTNLKGQTAKLHEGLGCYFVDPEGETHHEVSEDVKWVDAYGEDIPPYSPTEEFEKFVGLPIKIIEKVIERIEHPSRCQHCGSKQLEWISGYPGEELLMCSKCNHVSGSTFNKSAIE